MVMDSHVDLVTANVGVPCIYTSSTLDKKVIALLEWILVNQDI